MAEQERAICANCVHYPWDRTMDPSMLPAMACHPVLRGMRWDADTMKAERDCALYKPLTGDASEAALESNPAPSTQSEVKKPGDGKAADPLQTPNAMGGPGITVDQVSQPGTLTVNGGHDGKPAGTPETAAPPQPALSDEGRPRTVGVDVAKGADGSSVQLLAADGKVAPTDAELEGMKYQDLKQFAARNKIDPEGKHDVLLARVKEELAKRRQAAG